MQKFYGSRGLLILFGSFLALAAGLLLLRVLLSPSEPASAILLGLSPPRLVLALGLFLALLLFGGIAVRAAWDRAWGKSQLERWFGEGPLAVLSGWAAAVVFGLGWIGCFLPDYRAGPLAVHWERLRPAMAFLLLAGLAALVVLCLRRARVERLDRAVAQLYRSSLLWFLPAALGIGLMLVSGFGASAREDYWYGAGVPVLISQLIAAVAAGLAFVQVERRWSWRRLDLVVFLLIYAVSAFLWASEPLQKSFLFIGPYAPNRVLYPFADAAIFDTASQFALIGQNFFLFDGQFFERALYISFLVYLHSLFGQDYTLLMAAQAAVFAVLPALVYLVGRSLDGRAVGFAAGLVTMFRGANAIAASNMIDMASPKMMLTDFPTAIGVALVVLLTCEWLKRPGEKWHYALWIGGVTGLAIMLRTNALVLLALLPLYALLRFRRAWRPWLIGSSLIVLAAVAVTLPWELRNRSLGGQMYASIVAKFQNVLQRRYTPPVQPDSRRPQEEILSTLSLKGTQPLLSLATESDLIQEPSCSSTACFVPNHFLHNVLTSMLVLPTSLVLDDLRHTVRESHEYWRPDWDGRLPWASLVFLALNLFLIVLGVRAAWERHRLAGLAPLAIFAFYNLSNGFARTSGGRYIVPIDWILTVYFLIGLFYTVMTLARAVGRDEMPLPRSAPRDAPQSIPGAGLSKALPILVVLFGLGALIPLAESVHPPRYQGYDTSRLLAEHEAEFARAGLNREEIRAFLQTPGAEVSVGRALYPRYYLEYEGEVHFYPMVTMGFPRTTFTLIGPAGEKGIVLPGEKPGYFPHAVDAIVLGCREPFYVDALAVIVLDEQGAVYTRSPDSPLTCPLRQPVCDNNHNCY